MKSKELAQLLHQELMEDPLVKEYQFYESQMIRHEELLELEQEIKLLQKELLSSKLNEEDISLLQEEYFQKKKLFEEHPLVVNYLNIKEELNDQLIEIETLINEGLSKEVD